MLMPKKTRIASRELLRKKELTVAEKDVYIPKHPELAKNTVSNRHVVRAEQPLKSRGQLCEGAVGLGTFLLVSYQRSYPVSVVTSTYPPRWCLPRCTTAILRLAGRRPKGLEGQQPARLGRGKTPREAPTDEVLCPLAGTRKPRLGRGQPPSSSLEENLVGRRC